MKTFYDIEDFVVTQMFRPYLTVYFNCGINEVSEEKVKAYEQKLRNDPMCIMKALCDNKMFFCLVFGRLARMEWKFYKWLKHPLIDVVNSIVNDARCTARDKNQIIEKAVKNLYPAFQGQFCFNNIDE